MALLPKAMTLSCSPIHSGLGPTVLFVFPLKAYILYSGFPLSIAGVGSHDTHSHCPPVSSERVLQEQCLLSALLKL